MIKVEDVEIIGHVHSALKLSTLPKGTTVLGVYPMARHLADLCVRGDDGKWYREGMPPVEVTDFGVWPVPVVAAPPDSQEPK